MDMQVLDTRRDSSGGYKLDVSRGSRVSRVGDTFFVHIQGIQPGGRHLFRTYSRYTT